MTNTTNTSDKNNWSKLLGSIANGIMIVYNKDNQKVFQIDIIFALILAIFITVLLIIFLLLVLTENWYFVVVEKEKSDTSKSE